MSKSSDLYKKYRPKTFDEVIGQDQIVESLRRTVLKGVENTPTGYLFAGGPGTGKTTCALIFSKALNCLNLKEDGNPCNECESCKAIDSDSSMGVHYIPMSNNGSADFVKKIVEDARIAQPVKKQVFILDEVQNLSNQAFDALLKPLESDTMKSMFIMCTTEPEKVRPAVLSRTQIRNFRPVSDKILARHLAKISAKEGWYKKDADDNLITPLVIKNIIDISEGSVRNAIGNLEAYIDTGIIETKSTNEIIKSILNKDPIGLYKTTKMMEENGESYQKSLEIIYKILLDTLIKMSGKQKLNSLETNISKKFTPNLTLWALDTIGNGLNLMSNKTINYRIIFETTMIKILIKINK